MTTILNDDNTYHGRAREQNGAPGGGGSAVSAPGTGSDQGGEGWVPGNIFYGQTECITRYASMGYVILPAVPSADT